MWVNCYLNNLKYRIFVPVVGINKGCYRAASPLERGIKGDVLFSMIEVS